MQRAIKKSPLAAAILLSISSSPLIAAPGDTVGSEFLVNTETTLVEDASGSSGGGGGALSWLSFLLFVPLCLRRRLG